MPFNKSDVDTVLDIKVEQIIFIQNLKCMMYAVFFNF